MLLTLTDRDKWEDTFLRPEVSVQTWHEMMKWDRQSFLSTSNVTRHLLTEEDKQTSSSSFWLCLSDKFLWLCFNIFIRAESESRLLASNTENIWMAPTNNIWEYFHPDSQPFRWHLICWHDNHYPDDSHEPSRIRQFWENENYWTSVLNVVFSSSFEWVESI